MHTAQVTTKIHAPVERVWDALINPELIKQYLFGAEAISDWKEGSTLIYKSVWEGKEYEDHGVIKEVIPEKKLVTTYWSAAFGEDIPENYKTVSYVLELEGDDTTLTITQENNPTEESKEHSEKNWTMVLDTMKKLLEDVL
jgi:uncharacterized protein YndB with AHSA1/START domain